MAATELILDARDIHAWYGSSHVLHGVALQIAKGETVGLLGRNGMGKTTTVRSLLGLTPARSGSVRFRGERIHGLAPDRIARMGLAVVPQSHAAQARRALTRPLDGPLAFSRHIGLACDASDAPLLGLLHRLADGMKATAAQPEPTQRSNVV